MLLSISETPLFSIPKNVFAVYVIMNIVSRKVYVGKTGNPYQRVSQYKTDMVTLDKRRINSHLRNAIIKHGRENFTFFIIEIYDTDRECSDGELKWMDAFSSTDRDRGYNIRRDTSTKMITHDETRIKISKRLKKEWAEGTRSGHSEKLKKSWENRDRKKQGEQFSRCLTKYSYRIFSNGKFVDVNYKVLVALGLRGCISSFHKKKTTTAICKSFVIEKVRNALP